MNNNLFDLTGKVAIITGAARGIGRVLAQGLAQVGVKVVIADINQTGGEETAQLIKQSGGESIAIHTDVCNRQDCLNLIEQTVSYYGKLDIMICNAGIEILKPTYELEEAEWDAVINVDLKGYFNCAQLAAKQMIKQGTGGSIIMNSSICGFVAVPKSSGAYSAAKGGVNLLLKSLAVELANYKIRVNAFAPGYMNNMMEGTENLRSTSDEMSELYARIPLKRTGNLEELIGPVIFLASEASSYVTGTTLMVDGGYTAI
jgi:NAD(P)-dependent dehydrogenase (short-subunit alcohol dehydrogenase family)